MGKQSKAKQQRSHALDRARSAILAANHCKEDQHGAAKQPLQPQLSGASTFPCRADLPSPSAAPADKQLMAQLQTLPTLLQPSYWQQICPGLHCCSGPTGSKAGSKQDDAVRSIALPHKRLAGLRQQVDDAGVAQVSAAELPWACGMDVLALSVVQLLQHGWPPAFLVLFDEVWDMIQQMEDVVMKATGNACNMDILAWYVDPSEGHSGFSPHRDRQPDDSPATFRQDGSAMYTTAWIPFTDACPENSCLYVVPRYADPGYHEGDPEDEHAPDPLQRALPNKEAYQHIRALPAQAGDAVIFTHRIIHWGSQGRRGYHTPRISMSFGCADDAFEAPYFSRQHLPRPPLGLRLALAGAQMIVYHERFNLDAKLLSLCHKAFQQHAGEFDAAYRRKVTSEFVAASKEVAAGAPRSSGQLGHAAAGQQPCAASVDARATGGTCSRASDGGKGGGGGAGVHAGAAPAVKRPRAVEAANGHAADGANKRPRQSQQAQQHLAQARIEATSSDGFEDSEDSGDGDADWGNACNGSEGMHSDGGSDVLDLALDSMLDAHLAGFDDFDDDFEDHAEVDGAAGSDEEEGEDEAGEYDEHGLALAPGERAAGAAAGSVAPVPRSANGSTSRKHGGKASVRQRKDSKAAAGATHGLLPVKGVRKGQGLQGSKAGKQKRGAAGKAVKQQH